MPSTSERRVERIGHRGIPVERLENTLSSFILAFELGANAVELDAHVSADGVVVVHHDATIGDSAIASMTWREINAIELAPGVKIPRLDEVLGAAAGRATVYVELKGASIEQQVVALVRQHKTAVALHSFDHASVERASLLAPDIPRGVLLESGVTNPVQVMRRAVERTKARDVWPHWSLVSSDLVRAAEDLDARVIAWTINSVDRARHLQSLGVAGLCTDDVRILANL